MERDLHYTVDEKQKSVLITEEGYEAAEDVLQVCAAAQPGSRYMLLHQGQQEGIVQDWHFLAPSLRRNAAEMAYYRIRIESWFALALVIS